MKNEVNRALVAEKKQYIIPQVEATAISTVLMKTGPASVLPGPGSQSSAPKQSNTEPF